MMKNQSRKPGLQFVIDQIWGETLLHFVAKKKKKKKNGTIYKVQILWKLIN
jgi:hypothetical protein